MNTLETDADIAADGSMKLLAPLPEWLKPGRQHVLLVLTGSAGAAPARKREKITATPEMLERRRAAFEALRKLNPFRDIEDPVAWQQESRGDRPLPFRD